MSAQYPYSVQVEFSYIHDQDRRQGMQAWLEENTGVWGQDWTFGVNEIDGEDVLFIYFTDQKKAAIFKLSCEAAS